jgi:hypothetical protein
MTLKGFVAARGIDPCSSCEIAFVGYGEEDKKDRSGIKKFKPLLKLTLADNLN